MGLIRIDIVRFKGQLHLIVADNGKGMPEAEVQRIRDMINTPNLQLQSSIALYNINQRIRLRYGEAYGVRLDSCVGIGTQVALILPGNTPEGA